VSLSPIGPIYILTLPRLHPSILLLLSFFVEWVNCLEIK
jgi:hypothetical protein